MLESQQNITIIDPLTAQLFPSLVVGGRLCVAVVAGSPFAVRVAGSPHSRTEAVLAVDGRDTLTNRPADPSASGIVFNGTYVCKGFRVSEREVREFVAAAVGAGYTTAERNASAECCGLIAAVVYGDGRSNRPAGLESFGGPVTRGAGVMRGGGAAPVMRGGSVGAAAGQSVESHVGQTSWTRGGEIWRAVIEYDTLQGWAARGIIIPGISMANPWPGEQRFAAVSTL